MKANIDSYISAIINDNKQYITNFASIADYIICRAMFSTGWYEYFDDDELADNVGQEPTEEQVDELTKYIEDVYGYPIGDAELGENND